MLSTDSTPSLAPLLFARSHGTVWPLSSCCWPLPPALPCSSVPSIRSKQVQGPARGLSLSTRVATTQRSVSEVVVSPVLHYWEKLEGCWNGSTAPDQGLLLHCGCSHTAMHFLSRTFTFKHLKQHKKSRKAIPTVFLYSKQSIETRSEP